MYFFGLVFQQSCASFYCYNCL